MIDLIRRFFAPERTHLDTVVELAESQGITLNPEASGTANLYGAISRVKVRKVPFEVEFVMHHEANLPGYSFVGTAKNPGFERQIHDYHKAVAQAKPALAKMVYAALEQEYKVQMEFWESVPMDDWRQTALSGVPCKACDQKGTYFTKTTPVRLLTCETCQGSRIIHPKNDSLEHWAHYLKEATMPVAPHMIISRPGFCYVAAATKLNLPVEVPTPPKEVLKVFAKVKLVA